MWWVVLWWCVCVWCGSVYGGVGCGGLGRGGMIWGRFVCCGMGYMCVGGMGCVWVVMICGPGLCGSG
jgi:hypothetical protein